jgi:hypothetical protein
MECKQTDVENDFWYWQVIENKCSDCSDTCSYESLPGFQSGVGSSNLYQNSCGGKSGYQNQTMNVACKSIHKDPEEDPRCDGCSIICQKNKDKKYSFDPDGYWSILESCASPTDPNEKCFCSLSSELGKRCYETDIGSVQIGNCQVQDSTVGVKSYVPVVLVNNKDYGTVELSPIEDGLITINAIPTDGYELSGWVGDISGKSTEIQFLVDGEMDISAVFTPTPDLGKPKPKIIFQVNLISENDFNSTLLSRVPKEGQTLSDFDMNINSRSLNIPGVDGTFKHGDLVIVYGKDAEQLKRTYDKGGPFDTLKVASVDWNA